MFQNSAANKLAFFPFFLFVFFLLFLSSRLLADANSTLTPLLVIDDKSSGAPIGTLDSCVLDSSGNLLVTDKRRMLLHVLNPITGKLIRTIGVKGAGELQFDQPNGIAVDDQGRIFVTEQTNRRVQVLNRDYSFAGFIGGPGSGAGQFDKPMGIAADATGRIYVTDENLNKVAVFDRVAGSRVSWQFKFEFADSGAGKIDHAESITIDRARQRIYLSDEGQLHVKVYDLNGKFLQTFGSGGTGLGQFSASGQPKGITVDENHYIFFIVDQGNDRVQVFDLNKMKALFSTAVKENRRGDLPASFHLAQNYPNPFSLARSATTRIEMSLPANFLSSPSVQLEIFDLLGRLVRTYSLAATGTAAIEWEGRNSQGIIVPAGIYSYRLSNGNSVVNRRLVLLH